MHFFPVGTFCFTENGKSDLKFKWFLINFWISSETKMMMMISVRNVLFFKHVYESNNII